MSETIPQTIWQKMRYTPMRDFLRGKLTGRMDLRRPLEESPLPPPLQQVIRRVVGRTFLWRMERLEVTHELIAHFADGLAAGNSSEELVRKFGDEKQAALLIRRAKRRGRSAVWQAWRFACWSTAVFFVFYFGYAVYFFTGEPSPRVHYVATINQVVEKTPIEDRAWPLYRRALLGFGSVRELEAYPQFNNSESPKFLQFLKEHQKEVEWIRQGGEKAKFGFLIGANGSAFDPELWPNRTRPSVDPVVGEDLASVALPPLQTIRLLSASLRADAVLARQTHDRERLRRDLQSLMGLARHIGDDAPLLWGLVSLSIFDMAFDQIERTLRESPTLLEQDDWMAITAQLSQARVAADLISFDSERLWFQDMLQRSFTDDGSGNGRFTPAGVRYFDAGFSKKERAVLRSFMVHPAVSFFVPSRQQLSSEYMNILDRASANLKLPLREADWSQVQQDLENDRTSFRTSWNLMAISRFTPSFWFAQARAEMNLSRRDGVVVGIALERYRKEHREYPQNLQALVPTFLADIPADRADGQPLRYRVTEGKALIYSVGADRDDDGGRAPRWPYSAQPWDMSNEPVPDGDWLVYSSK